MKKQVNKSILFNEASILSEPLSHVNEHIETSSRLTPAPSSVNQYHHHNRHHRHSQQSPPPNSRSPLSSDEHTSGETSNAAPMKGYRYKKIARYQTSDHHHHREPYSSSKHSSSRSMDGSGRSIRGSKVSKLKIIVGRGGAGEAFKPARNFNDKGIFWRKK